MDDKTREEEEKKKILPLPGFFFFCSCCGALWITDLCVSVPAGRGRRSQQQLRRKRPDSFCCSCFVMKKERKLGSRIRMGNILSNWGKQTAEEADEMWLLKCLVSEMMLSGPSLRPFLPSLRPNSQL